MQIELNELKDFIEQIKADRTAAKEKEKREAWTKYVSLTLVCIAVLTGIATLKGGGFTTLTLKQMNEATFAQAQASDQWAFFQAKSIKKNLYEIASANGGPNAESFAATAKTNDDESKEIKSKATELEKQVEERLQASEKHEQRLHGLTFAATLLHIAQDLAGGKVMRSTEGEVGGGEFDIRRDHRFKNFHRFADHFRADPVSGDEGE